MERSKNHDVQLSPQRGVFPENGDRDRGKIRSLSVLGGCDGNLQGIARLVEGMEIDEAIRRLEGIRCGSKPTSCPDQLAQALKQIRAGE